MSAAGLLRPAANFYSAEMIRATFALSPLPCGFPTVGTAAGGGV